MKKSAHTPGPWTIAPDGSGRNSYAIWDSLNRMIGSTRPCADYDKRNGSPMQPTTNEANARLIASSPDMMTALIDARDMLETAKRYFPKSIQNRDRFSLLNVLANSVEPAIKKAKGE